MVVGSASGRRAATRGPQRPGGRERGGERMAPRGGGLARERVLGAGLPRTDQPRVRSGAANGGPSGAHAVPNGRKPPDPPDEPAPELATAAWKLSPPPTPAGTVHRRELVARLRAARDASLLVVSARSGFGKTPLLAHWAATDRRAFAWLTVDARDADPAVFLRHVAAAVTPLCEVPGPSVRDGRRPAM